jgi:hypothetical protein
LAPCKKEAARPISEQVMSAPSETQSRRKGRLPVVVSGAYITVRRMGRGEEEQEKGEKKDISGLSHFLVSVASRST